MPISLSCCCLKPSNPGLEVDDAIAISSRFQKKKLDEAEATKKLKNLLTDYTQRGGEQASLKKFIERCGGVKNYTIVPDAHEIGWSPNRAYWIQDSNTKEKLLFLKTFGDDSKRYLPEIFSHAFLQGVRGVVSPKIKALGQVEIEGKHHFLMLESVTQGSSIQQLYEEVSGHAAASLELREKVFNNLKEGVSHFGKSLAALHSHLKNLEGPLPDSAKNYLLKLLDKGTEQLKIHPQEGIGIEELQKHAHEVIGRMQEHQHRIGVTHGDIKLIHTFYDPATKTASLIEPYDLISSIDDKGMPQGMPSRDYCWYVQSLILNRVGYSLDGEGNPYRKELLTEQQVEAVLEAFKQGYREGGGILPTREEERFFLLCHNLLFLGSLSRALPEPGQMRLKDLIEVSLVCLRAQLNIN